MEARPRIKLILSPFDHALEWAGKICLVLMWFLVLYTFFKLPSIIPIHFDASGKANNYGSKITILFLPVFGTVIYFGLSQLNKYPHIFNYLTKITEENAHKQYTISTRMLRFLKLSILVIFSVIILFTYLTTIGAVNGLGYWFLPLVFGLLIIPTAIGISQSFSKKNNSA